MKKLYDGGALIGIGMLIVFIGIAVLGFGVSKNNKHVEDKKKSVKIHVLMPQECPPVEDLPPPEPLPPSPASPPQEETKGGSWWWPF